MDGGDGVLEVGAGENEPVEAEIVGLVLDRQPVPFALQLEKVEQVLVQLVEAAGGKALEDDASPPGRLDPGRGLEADRRRAHGEELVLVGLGKPGAPEEAVEEAQSKRGL